MRPEQSAEAFTGFSESQGIDLRSATPALGIDTMTCFYNDMPAECLLDEDGADMLLYQWGTYDWGKGPSFQLNITRQFVEMSEEEEQGIMSQLYLVFHYSPSTQFDEFGEGNRWCNGRNDLNDFVAFIQQSEPFQLLKDSPPDRIELQWSMI